MIESLGSNFELTRFSGRAPLFPLPNVVFFPKTLLPLHIFENRYKRMVRDALENERMICMVLLKDGEDPLGTSNPLIHQIGTLGYIEEVETLREGKFNIILNGLIKVKISEIDVATPYRQGNLDIIQDTVKEWKEEEEREKMLGQFRQITEAIEGDFPFGELESANVSLEVLTNLLCTWLPIPDSEKQKLLELDNLAIRSEIVREYLRQEIEDYSFLQNLEINLPGDPRWN